MKKSLSNQRVVDVGTKKNIGITRGSSTGLWDQHTRTSQVTGNVSSVTNKIIACLI